jgi:hypothetical protein
VGVRRSQIDACALAATCPAYEAIRHVGEAEFELAAVERSSGQREGFPLPAELNVVGYLACKPAAAQGP